MSSAFRRLELGLKLCPYFVPTLRRDFVGPYEAPQQIPTKSGRSFACLSADRERSRGPWISPPLLRPNTFVFGLRRGVPAKLPNESSGAKQDRFAFRFCPSPFPLRGRSSRQDSFSLAGVIFGWGIDAEPSFRRFFSSIRSMAQFSLKTR